MNKRTPQHIGFIMDGNSRWGKNHGLDNIDAYHNGIKTAKRVVSLCKERGVRYVTLYAFSTENWQRPQSEVNTLMQLFKKYLSSELSELRNERTRIIFIGNRHELDPEISSIMTELEDNSQSNEYDITVLIALNYGGKQEILASIQKTVVQVISEGKVPTLELCTKIFGDNINPHHIPDPDLVIRTGGAIRISNFLLWYISYAELYFTPTLWPDFDAKELDKALDDFRLRTRNYGT